MSTALWYAGRGFGVSALVLLSLVVVLGILTRSGRPLPGLPRFAVAALHRTTSLTGVLFVALHVLTLSLDPYAQLHLVDAVVPFLGTFRPVWQGLGTVAMDLIVLLVGSSLLRHRLGLRTWRVLHWTAYLFWPVAILHAFGNGTDGHAAWMLAVLATCLAAVVGAVGWRLVGSSFAPEAAPRPGVGAARTGGAAMTTVQAPVVGLLAARALTYHEHVALVGELPDIAGPELVAVVQEAGLTGRGGAAFPSGRKLAAVAVGGSAVVVANGAEGEPASSKDLCLMTTAPHLVLDGLVLAARATSASTAYFYAPERVLDERDRPSDAVSGGTRSGSPWCRRRTPSSRDRRRRSWPQSRACARCRCRCPRSTSGASAAGRRWSRTSRPSPTWR